MGLNPIGTKTNLMNAFSKEEAGIYAKKGEPIYLKEMDYDEDGKVTFDEFREYCKENGLSADDITKLLETRLMYKLLAESKETQEEQKEKSDKIYSKKGDDNYDESMDSNDDGLVTYNEYMDYCKNNAKEETINKIVDAYKLKEFKEEDIKIESEA